MNWIYVDRDTYEIKFGTRPYAQPNLTGPFDCTRQDRRLTFAGWEGFLAVKEGDFWALYFDVENNKLRTKVGEDTPVLEIELNRVEMRVKPAPPEKEAAEKEGECKQTQDGAGKNGSSIETKEENIELESPDVD
jgi:hypothetical protein